MITQERLKELLTYAPETGLFYWNKDMRGGKKKGQVAGCKSAADKHGREYIKIGLENARYYAHRLAWLYMKGEWPLDHVDHMNGDSLNNSWNNLRLANKSQNGFNAKLSRRNKLGVKGVYQDKRRGTYQAEIVFKRQKYYLGSFKTAEEAHQAYMAAAVKFSGEYARSI